MRNGLGTGIILIISIRSSNEGLLNMNARQDALKFVRENQDRTLNELQEFLSIPSISTASKYHSEVQRAAEWAAARLKALGCDEVQIYPSPPTHPIVYGQIMAAGPEAQTMLVYGHYDVQPTDPLELWESPPFEPEIRGDYLYGRGSSDMKGQVLAAIAAVEAVTQTSGLPINIKFLIEGEEEIGSQNMGPTISSLKEQLACDFSLNPDAGMLAADLPTIKYALRGMATFELRFYGPSRDLHSGSYGGVVHNPAQALCEVIAKMHDEGGRVTLPGFYDRVQSLDEDERAELARLPRDASYYLQQTGAPTLWGESDFTPVERVGARPTLEINGMISGYTEEGMKTVLPATAMAKISMRLVPHQDPSEVAKQFESFLEKTVPPGIRWELTHFAGNPASISDRTSTAVQAMSDALEQVWGTRPLFARVGGSIPVVGMVQDILGVESVLTGFSLPEDNVHSPNERLHLPTWQRGIEALVHFIYNLR
jgi:acetylornithine deacetylase/succinyl-diaminopimelate desuccinylase-like protein